MQFLWVSLLFLLFTGNLNAQYTLPIEKAVQGLLKENKTKEARRSLLQYYQQNPRSYHAPYALYRYAQLSQDPQEFIGILKQILRGYANFPELDEVLLNLGDLFFLRGELSKSLAYYTRLLKLFSKSPHRPRTLYSIARIHFQKRNSQELQKTLQVLLREQSEPNKTRYFNSILFLKGQLEIQKGLNPKIVSLYKTKKNSQTQKGQERILYGLAEFHVQSGELSLAREYFRRIVKEYPNTKEAFLSKQRITKQRLAPQNYFLQLAVFQNLNNAKRFLKKIQKTVLNQKIFSDYKQDLYLYTEKGNTEKRSKMFQVILGPIHSQKDLGLFKRNLSEKKLRFLVLTQVSRNK